LKQFKETGSVAKQKSSGWPGSSKENVECIRQSCVNRLSEFRIRDSKNYNLKYNSQVFTP
jgi:hypothetical protein